MATFRRSVVPGATYFFTVVTQQRQAVLTQPEFRAALKAAFRQVKNDHPFTIDTFVLLPDHLHCLWTLPPADADYAKRWSLIKRRVSQQTRGLLADTADTLRQKRGELNLWQRRFWEHQIRDDADFAQHADYIHFNPVKHGYVRRAADWQYTSLHLWIRRGWCNADWGGEGNSGPERAYGEPL
jgi:putative transposase